MSKAFARAIEIMVENEDVFPEENREQIVELLTGVKQLCEGSSGEEVRHGESTMQG